MTSLVVGARVSARNSGLRSEPKVVESKLVRPKRSRELDADADELKLANAK
jgi:hypothetical protein